MRLTLGKETEAARTAGGVYTPSNVLRFLQQRFTMRLQQLARVWNTIREAVLSEFRATVKWLLGELDADIIVLTK